MVIPVKIRTVRCSVCIYHQEYVKHSHTPFLHLSPATRHKRSHTLIHITKNTFDLRALCVVSSCFFFGKSLIWDTCHTLTLPTTCRQTVVVDYRGQCGKVNWLSAHRYHPLAVLCACFRLCTYIDEHNIPIISVVSVCPLALVSP